jgi:hypothetical protein
MSTSAIVSTGRSNALTAPKISTKRLRNGKTKCQEKKTPQTYQIASIRAKRKFYTWLQDLTIEKQRIECDWVLSFVKIRQK